MLEINEELKYDLESRIVKGSDKTLLIFPNREIMERAKRWFKGRGNIIYMTETEVHNRGLTGLFYGSYEFADELTLMRMGKGTELINNLEKEVK